MADELNPNPNQAGDGNDELNPDDAGGDDVAKQLKALNANLPGMISGCVKRMLSKQKAASLNNRVNMNQEINLDGGGTTTIGELLNAKEENSKLKETAMIATQLKLRGIMSPDVIASGLQSQGVSCDDSDFFDNFGFEHPELVKGRTGAGAGTQGGQGGGGKPGVLRIKASNQAAINKHTREIAEGTAIVVD